MRALTSKQTHKRTDGPTDGPSALSPFFTKALSEVSSMNSFVVEIRADPQLNNKSTCFE